MRKALVRKGFAMVLIIVLVAMALPALAAPAPASTDTYHPVAKKAIFQLVKLPVMFFWQFSNTVVALKNGEFGNAGKGAVMTAISPVNCVISTVVDVGTIVKDCDPKYYYGPAPGQEAIRFP
jgi:hypothetical protein